MKTSERSDMKPSVLKNCSCYMLVLPSTINCHDEIICSDIFRGVQNSPFCRSLFQLSKNGYTSVTAFRDLLLIMPKILLLGVANHARVDLLTQWGSRESTLLYILLGPLQFKILGNRRLAIVSTANHQDDWKPDTFGLCSRLAP